MINGALAYWYLGTTSGSFTIYLCEGTAPTQAQLEALMAASLSGSALVNQYCVNSGSKRLKTFTYTGSMQMFNAAKRSHCSLTLTGNTFHQNGTAQFFIMMTPVSTWPYVAGSVTEFGQGGDMEILGVSVDEAFVINLPAFTTSFGDE